MSPITFRYHVTCAATNSDALATCFRKANTLSRFPVAADFFCPPLCPRHFCRVIAKEANVFIVGVFGANNYFQKNLCQKFSCHFYMVYIQAPPLGLLA